MKKMRIIVTITLIFLSCRMSLGKSRWRADGRCGINHPLSDGSPSECDSEGYSPCCSGLGYCGATRAHCLCSDCHDYRKFKENYPKWRKDKRCGDNIPLPNGKPTECDPDSDYPCCSNFGWCGGSIMHCSCRSCVSYRKYTHVVKSKWRRDLKCGWRYPLPDGTETECNPDSFTPCCASTGLCGATKDHCSCAGCKDYRRKTNDFKRWRPDKICGKNYPLIDGLPTECNPDSDFPCCSNYGFCGASKAHCECTECVDYRQKHLKSNMSRKGKNKSRCGRENPCDPHSDNPCCSEKGVCGASPQHCLCDKCFDSRHGIDDIRRWRMDHRCGSKFPLSGGEPTECDPKSDRPCCSPYGFCGGSQDHCSCRKCIDYRDGTSNYPKWRKDGYCGLKFPLPNGAPTECDPDSNSPCCSANGFCGKSKEHCDCKLFVDYRFYLK